MTRVRFAAPEDVMRRAIELARLGAGHVEPNPQVGAVIVDDRLQLVAEGFHERYGAAHAEVAAIAAAGEGARGATLYVTLEPCCHMGKTPPCTEAVIAAGLKKVVVGAQDPFPQVAGRGLARLREAGLTVEVGLLEMEVRGLIAPFRKLVETGLPWVHAKWAMTLDGRIASRTGASKWISNAASRAVVHSLRGRMDAIVIGRGTALADDPLLTARPAGPRVAARVVFDSRAQLHPDSQLVRTAGAAPVIVAAGPQAPSERIRALRERGVEVLEMDPDRCTIGGHPAARAVVEELGRRRFTNILVEGGAELLGAFFDSRLVDEVHIFVSSKLLGGALAKSPIGGTGRDVPPDLPDVAHPQVELLDGDVYIHGRIEGQREVV